MRKKRRRKTNRPVIQEHHITYTPPRTVIVYRGEHFVLSQLQWRKRVSKGLLEALEQFIIDNKEEAFELKKEVSLVEKGA